MRNPWFFLAPTFPPCRWIIRLYQYHCPISLILRRLHILQSNREIAWHEAGAPHLVLSSYNLHQGAIQPRDGLWHRQRSLFCVCQLGWTGIPRSFSPTGGTPPSGTFVLIWVLCSWFFPKISSRRLHHNAVFPLTLAYFNLQKSCKNSEGG